MGRSGFTWIALALSCIGIALGALLHERSVANCQAINDNRRQAALRALILREVSMEVSKDSPALHAKLRGQLQQLVVLPERKCR